MVMIVRQVGHTVKSVRRRKAKKSPRLTRFTRQRVRSPELRRGRSESPQKKDPERKTVFKRLEKGVFYRLGDKGKRISTYSNDSRRQSYHISRRDTKSGYQSSHSREQNSLLRNTITKEHPHAGRKHYQKAKLWVCEETNPFTPRIRYFDLPKRTRMPSQFKTYDESKDTEDHLKTFQAEAKVERWAMPTWCHMFNSTFTGSVKVWFDELPPESVDSYDDIKEAFLAKFRQQKNASKIMWKSTISSREKESLRRIFCVYSSRRDDEDNHILPQGEVTSGNQERKKSLPPWK
ncbi:hypothetical protein Tco_0783378 [Tanacetum coccineum]